MKLSEFNYHLPKELIAQQPLKKRDESRLMVVNRQDQSITHHIFKNIIEYLPKKSTLVVNDSKVVSARLLGKRATGGEVEIFLLKPLEDGYSYEALMRPMKRLKDNEEVQIGGNGLRAQIVDKEKRIVRLNKKNMYHRLDNVGHIPLPPYIQRDDDSQDKSMYQTVYAKKNGSVASPTAGRHFTNQLIKRIEKSGSRFKSVTLHINYGTFKPVEVDNVEDHQMYYEDYQITKSAWQGIQKAKEKKECVVAVGTTSTRVLESVAQTQKLKGSTNIFISPGYQFKTIDALITNFHLPHSTLLMLVYAFGGSKLIKKAYQEAKKNKYRFYSYGDAMLII